MVVSRKSKPHAAHNVRADSDRGSHRQLASTRRGQTRCRCTSQEEETGKQGAQDHKYAYEAAGAQFISIIGRRSFYWLTSDRVSTFRRIMSLVLDGPCTRWDNAIHLYLMHDISRLLHSGGACRGKIRLVFYTRPLPLALPVKTDVAVDLAHLGITRTTGNMRVLQKLSVLFKPTAHVKFVLVQMFSYRCARTDEESLSE